MKKNTMPSMDLARPETLSTLEEIAREGARKMLDMALKLEVQEYLEKYADLLDEKGRKQVVRNGYHEERTILTGIGALPVKQPRVDDRALEAIGKDRFTSAILPKFMRRAATIDALLPILYLKGISTDDFPCALEAILGPTAKGLSASTIVRLKEVWTDDYNKWSKRSLTEKHYVYIWVDGVYCNARLEDERSCLLVVMGADKQGVKELISVSDGIRESEQSWKEILLDMRCRGLETPPKIAVCDGALGFQSAVSKVWPQTKIQRCWFHKTGNILNKLPSSLQGKAKGMIHNMYLSPTREEALKAYDLFVASFSDKYPQAVTCLVKDKDDLFNFYDFPASHWVHLRTSNPIESTFATVRLRHRKTKGNGTRSATLAMVFKLCQEAEKGWRKLRGYEKIQLVVAGRKFVNGELVDESAA